MKSFGYCELYMKNRNYKNILSETNMIHRLNPIIYSASSTDIPVLIIGEQGTCKSLFAKLIHENSDRKREKFLTVNFKNNEKDSLETDLFGYAYIDSNRRRLRKIGKFEQAHGGTILLNEIGSMAIGLQLKLLRTIDCKKIFCVEKSESISIDVRIISTSSENLELSAKPKNFREDLYYRISAFPIFIPPLREFPEDIGILADRFLKIIIKQFDKPIYSISSDAMKALVSYDWPGNIHELEKAIRYAVKLETSSVLQKPSLPKEIYISKKQHQEYMSTNNHQNLYEIVSLEEVEKLAIINAMRATGNNVQLTAKALGINRATVYRKLGKYRLLIK